MTVAREAELASAAAYWWRAGDGAAGAFSVAVGRALGTVVVTVHGELDTSSSTYLGGVLDDLIDAQGNLAVVIDLRDLRRIDASGLAALDRSARAMAMRGGELSLSGPGDDVRHALLRFGLADHVTVAHDAPTTSPRPDRHDRVRSTPDHVV